MNYFDGNGWRTYSDENGGVWTRYFYDGKGNITQEVRFQRRDAAGQFIDAITDAADRPSLCQGHTLDKPFHRVHNLCMTWDVEFTDEFEAWWVALTGEEQESIAASVGLLETVGPNLKHPHSSGINGSKHGHMRELRTQHEGRPYRTLYAFDPRRAAILLIGGDKTGNDRWYETQVPLADELYDEHLEELKKEGN